MALDPVILGRRLRDARENRQLTQEQAAQTIGISRTALVHIESGKRSLSTLEFSPLTKLYRRSPADFFAGEETWASREDDPLLIIHRLPTELVDDPEVIRQVSRYVELCAISVDLETTLGVRDPISLPTGELLEKGGPSRRSRFTFTSAGDEPAVAEERPGPGSQQITYQDVVALARHFGVSYAAAVYRLSDLGFMNADEKANLLERSELAAAPPGEE